MKIQVSNASQGLMGCDFFSGPEKTPGSASRLERHDKHKHAQDVRQNRGAENIAPWAAIKMSTHQAPRALAREGTHKKSCIFQQNSMQIQLAKASPGLMGCDFFSDPEKT